MSLQRHSVLCEGQLLIIYGLTVCGVDCTDDCNLAASPGMSLKELD